MRITAGAYRSRKLFVPPGYAIRPTSDKARQAIFNILKKYELPEDAVVLDAFCGSGALGLEALSRGASFCTFMDKDTSCCAKNISALGLENRVRFLKCDILKPAAAGKQANLVFLDPPYGKSLAGAALSALICKGWLADNAICVIECEKGAEEITGKNLRFLDRRLYGSAEIRFYECG